MPQKRESFHIVRAYLADHPYITSQIAGELCGLVPSALRAMMDRWSKHGELQKVAPAMYSLDLERGLEAARREFSGKRLRNTIKTKVHLARMVACAKQNGGRVTAEQIVALFPDFTDNYVRRMIREACLKRILVRVSLHELELPTPDSLQRAMDEQYRFFKFPLVRDYLQLHGAMSLEDIEDVADIADDRTGRTVKKWIREGRLVQRADGLYALPASAEAAE